MFSQRQHTILFVTLDAVSRVDMLSGKSVEVLRSSCLRRPEHATLGDAVKMGLGLRPSKCGHIYVLSNELWSGKVSLSDEIVGVVDQDQLEQTLSLEAEYESGISPFDSRLGHAIASTVDGQKTWWVTQAELSQLRQIAAAKPKWPGKIIGVSSPASFGLDPDDDHSSPLDLNSSDSCGDFAKAWLTQYMVDKSKLPFIDLPNQSWIEKQQRAIGMLTAATALLICIAMHENGSGQLASASTNLFQLVEQEKKLRLLLNEEEESSRLVREVKQQNEKLDAAQAQQRDARLRDRTQYAAMRTRPVQLLRALAESADPGHWLQSIKLTGSQVVISGVAVDSTSVTMSAQRLEAALDSSKWLVQPAKISIDEASRLVHFEMTLVPLNDASQPLTVASKGATDVR